MQITGYPVYKKHKFLLVGMDSRLQEIYTFQGRQRAQDVIDIYQRDGYLHHRRRTGVHTERERK